jgi:hypothetical protein
VRSVARRTEAVTDHVRPGAIARDLVGAGLGQRAVLRRDHRRRLGVEIAGDGDVAVVGQPLIPRFADLQPVGRGEAEIGDQQAGDRSPVGRQREARQRQEADAEQLEPRAAKAHRARLGLVDHLARGHPPARRPGAALLVLDVAGGIGRPVEQDVAVLDPPARFRRQPPALAQRQQHVLHRAGAELVVELEPLGEQLVAVLVDEADVAGGDDRARLAVPGHRVGADRLARAAQHDIAARGHRVVVFGIGNRIGLEIDRTGLRLGGRGGVLRVRRRGRQAGQQRQGQQQRGSGGKERPAR